MVQRLLPLQPGMPQHSVVKPASDIKYGSMKLDSTIRKQLRVETETSPKAANETNFLSNIKNGSQDMSKLLEIDDESDACDKKPDVNEAVSVPDADTAHPIEETQETQTKTIDDIGTEECTDSEDEEDRIRKHLNEDPGIQSLMEISLPSPIPLNPTSEECMYFCSNFNIRIF